MHQVAIDKGEMASPMPSSVFYSCKEVLVNWKNSDTHTLAESLKLGELDIVTFNPIAIIIVNYKS